MFQRVMIRLRVGFALALIVTLATAVQASVQYQLGTVFADTDPALAHASGSSYLTATFQNAGANTVRLTLQSNLTSLGLAPGSERLGYMIRNVWLQLGAAPGSSASGLGVAFNAGLSSGLAHPNPAGAATPFQVSATSSLQADGEDRFNVRIFFDGLGASPANQTARRFDGLDTAVFTLTRAGLTENDFRFMGGSAGGPLRLFMAAEILNAATFSETQHTGTFFVGAVPEAASAAIWSLLTTVGVCIAGRRRG